MNHRLLLFIILFVVTKTLPAQSTDARYKLFFEKVYLHTDREQYVSGEDIWFKVYLVNAQTNQLFNSSNNLYVELINPEAKIADRRLIRLDNGLGNGDFALGDSILHGTYRIRAYTNWMRNFGDNFVFEKEIQVYADTLRKSITNVNTNKKIQQKITAETSSSTSKSVPLPAIRFFPEGGAMIENVPGIVAFKTQDASGKGVAAKGLLKTADGSLITEFSSDDNGMGTFVLTPVAGQKLFISGALSTGNSFDVILPPALSKGFALTIRNADSTIKAIIGTNALTLNDFKDKDLTLIFRSGGKIYSNVYVQLKETQSALSFSKKDFPQGISSITLYDSSGKPQAERLFYHEGTNRAILSISTNKTSYTPKEKTILTIKATDNNNKPIKTNLSLAVTDARIVSENRSNILSYLNLQSEIRGKVENPNQYFDEKNLKRKHQLDMLLMTHGWRDFLWKSLADSVLRIGYIAENGITISGKLKHIWVNKPITNASITLTAWGAQGNKIYSTNTDSSGKFFLDGIKLFGNQALHLTSVDSKGKKAGFITVDTAIISMYPVKKTVHFDTVTSSRIFKEEVQKRMALTKKVSLSDTLQLNTVVIKSSQAGRTLSDTTYLINRADYAHKYLREYMLAKVKGAMPHPEIMQKVVFYGIGGQVQPRMQVHRDDPYYVTSPTPGGAWGPISPHFSLDSVKLHGIKPPEQSDYLNLPMDKIISVQLVHTRNTGGRFGDRFNIFLKVKPNAFDRQGLQKLNFDIDGYYEARTFFSPKYETLSTKPDLRTTIHWEPNITTDEKGEATITYYNADPKNKVRIVAEGITENETPVVGTTEYNVK